MIRYLCHAGFGEAPVEEPGEGVRGELEEELHGAVAAPGRVLELVRHLQEVELLRAQLGGRDAARRKILRPVVHHLGNLVPGQDC